MRPDGEKSTKPTKKTTNIWASMRETTALPIKANLIIDKKWLSAERCYPIKKTDYGWRAAMDRLASISTNSYSWCRSLINTDQWLVLRSSKACEVLYHIDGRLQPPPWSLLVDIKRVAAATTVQEASQGEGDRATRHPCQSRQLTDGLAPQSKIPRGTHRSNNCRWYFEAGPRGKNNHISWRVFFLNRQT